MGKELDHLFYQLGRKAGTQLRKGRWVWSSLAGSDAEALKAEYQAGLEMARSFEGENSAADDPAGNELLQKITARLC